MLIFNQGKESAYAEVILPLPLPKTFTYLIPSELVFLIKTGARVLVQFGKSKILTGIVKTIHHETPVEYIAKEILELLDEIPLISSPQLKLIEWVSNYYMCSLGEVMNAALPSGLKLSSNSSIQINPDFPKNDSIPFSEKEQLVLNALEKNECILFKELTKYTGISSCMPLVKSLLAKEKILIFEEIKEKYSPKKIKRIRLASQITTRKKIEEVFDLLKSSEKQTAVILKILQLTPLSDLKVVEKGIEKTILKQTASDAVLKTLLKKGILEEFTELIPRFKTFSDETLEKTPLSPNQEKARDQILSQFNEKETVLLHGITGSGKTQIYIDLIERAIEGGSQVLYMLPEIALTTQIVNRLKKVFGEKLGVYHSKFTDNERVEIYKGIVAGKFNVVVGVRSSVFLPFDNLGLIIVDEEHDTSYKQQEPAPRYNAKDAALVLAQIHHCKTLLGTATPSVETYYNCCAEKWGLVELSERFAMAALPEIVLTNIRQERVLQRMQNEFSTSLLAEIQAALERKEQAILFQNRRGYSPFLTCENCAHVFSCKNCDVSLTYHQKASEIKCHYCGHTEAPPSSCPKCGSPKIKTSGYGTEKLEDELKLFLPEAVIARMDSDSTQKKNAYNTIINDFETGKTNVLIGTQMVTKGLDFDNVSLVGIFDADRIIYFPDFRSHERTYQLLVQVSGRAGRKDKKGKVLIQTANPTHYIFDLVIKNDYALFYKKEIEERQRFFYPPFSRMIKLTVKNRDFLSCKKTAKLLHEELITQLGKERVLGPETPVINRIRNLHLQTIYIKIEREKVSLAKVKERIAEQIKRILSQQEFRNSQINIDIDPL